MKHWLFAAILSLAAVLAPAKAMIISALALVLADLLTGVVASLKQRQRIASAKLQRTIVKLFIYELAIVLAFITEVYLLDGQIPASKVIAGYVGITELTSCLENLNIIGGGTLLRDVIKKLGSRNDG